MTTLLLFAPDKSHAAEVTKLWADDNDKAEVGLSPTAVTSLDSFKKALTHKKVQIIITDAQLGWLDTRQALHQARQKWPACAIILYTAVVDARQLAPYFQLGIAHYIVQPDQAGLKQAVQESLAAQKRKQRPPHIERRESLLEALGELAQQFYAKVESGTVWEILPNLCARFDVTRVRLLENQPTTPHKKQPTETNAPLQAELFYEWVVPRKRHEPASLTEPFCYATEGVGRWETELSQGKIITSPIADLPPEEARFLWQSIPDAQLVALIPIFSGGRWWGILELSEERPNYLWSQGEIEAFKSTATLLGAAVEIQRLVQAEQRQRQNAEKLTNTLQRQTSELRELFEMTLSLSETLEPLVLMHKLYEHLHALFPLDTFIATFCDKETNQLEIVLALEEGEAMGNIPVGLRLPQKEAGVTGWIAMKKKSVFISDLMVEEPPVPLRRTSNPAPRTWLGVPLIAGQRLVGVISLQAYRPHAFDKNDQRIIETLAAFVALAVDNGRLFQQETQRRRGAEALVTLATAIIEDSEQEKILDNVVQAIASFMPDISNCSITLFDEMITRVIAWHSWRQDDEASQRLQASLTQEGTISLEQAKLTRRAVQKSTPLNFYDLRLEQDLPEHGQQMIALGLRSLLLVPMRVHGRVVGMVHISVNDTPRHFSQREIDIAQSIANYGAVAVQNTRLRQTEQAQLNLTNTLREVGSLLTSENSLEEAYEQIFDLLAQVIDYKMVTIQLYNPQKERLFLTALRGFDKSVDVAAVVDGLGFDYVAKIMSSGQPYRVVPDTQKDPKWVEVPQLPYIRSSINCLLRVKDRIIGILNVDHTEPNMYTAESARIVLAFANQAAIALENARLYDTLQERVNELSIINQVTMVSTTALYLDELLAQTTAVLAEQRFPQYVGFYLLDEIGNCHVPHPSFHTAVGLPPPPRLFIDELELSDISPEERGIYTHPLHPTLQPFLQTQLSVPLQVNEKMVGLLTVGLGQDTPPPHVADFYFLQTIAGQLSTAVQRASLYEDAQLYAAQLSDRIAQRTTELQAEKDRTQAILDTAGEGIFFTDTTGKILYANEAIANQSGYLVNELIGRPIDEFYQPATTDSARRTLAHLRKHIEHKREWRGEIECTQRNGTPYTVSVNITPLTDNLSSQSGFVAVQADITHLKEVERLKTEFVSNVSHELRTPLTNIKTYLTLLRRGKPEKAERYLDVLTHETERLERLIQDLLDLSRLDTESTVMTLQLVSLTAVVEEILPIIQNKAHQHTLIWNPPPTDLHIMADSQHLQQAISRLAHNAIAYTPSDGTIVLTAGQDDSQPAMIYLSIRDNGPGLTPEDQEHLFERFFRGSAALETRRPGTGLGLPISQEIINRHRGHIEAHNNPDQGATFTIWLPQAKI